MKLRPVLITPPAEQVITLIEAKAHLRVDYDDDNTLIEAIVQAATDYLDGYNGVLGRCLVTQTWRQDFPCWYHTLALPFPTASDVAVAYDDADGNPQTVAGAYVAGMVGGPVVSFPASFSQGSLQDDNPAPVRVTFTTGYGAAAEVPWSIKAAILLHVGTLYEYRETIADNAKPTGAYEALIAPHRWGSI
jgi:uncharacterized phiE125 gp8 family phage protein